MNTRGRDSGRERISRKTGFAGSGCELYWLAGEQLRTSGMAVKQLKTELLICWNLNAAVKENDSGRERGAIYSFERDLSSCDRYTKNTRYAIASL